jgi:hypothetical protein
MRRRNGTSSSLTGLLLLGLSLGLGCAGLALTPISPLRFAYFDVPSASDAWSPKIAGWQRREKAQPAALLWKLPPVAEPAAADGVHPAAPVAPPGPGVVSPLAAHDVFERSTPVSPGSGSADLRSKYTSFLNERKREAARRFAEWIQIQAKLHYVPDGPIDHWATLEETLRADGDDCDGLELLTFQGLRELGFRDDEVFRAIVYRPSDGQHHMVTLWFESVDDPWVIDPTGAMTLGMPRMSELPSWVPLKVFGETAEYTVRRTPTQTPTRELAAHH